MACASGDVGNATLTLMTTNLSRSENEPSLFVLGDWAILTLNVKVNVEEAWHEVAAGKGIWTD